MVTHGGTPTTRLSFPRVLKTIKVRTSGSAAVRAWGGWLTFHCTPSLQEYAFVASAYPLILSLENHCKKDNRVRGSMSTLCRDGAQRRMGDGAYCLAGGGAQHHGR